MVFHPALLGQVSSAQGDCFQLHNIEETNRERQKDCAREGRLHTPLDPGETGPVLAMRVLAARSPQSTGEQPSLPQCWIFNRDMPELTHSLAILSSGPDEASYCHEARDWAGKWAPCLAWSLKHSHSPSTALIGWSAKPQSAPCSVFVCFCLVFNPMKPLRFFAFPFPSVKTRMQRIGCETRRAEESGMVLSFESVQLSGWWC